MVLAPQLREDYMSDYWLNESYGYYDSREMGFNPSKMDLENMSSEEDSLREIEEDSLREIEDTGASALVNLD